MAWAIVGFGVHLDDEMTRCKALGHLWIEGACVGPPGGKAKSKNAALKRVGDVPGRLPVDAGLPD